MIFGIYCRKSVLNEKSESIEVQIQLCREYIYSRIDAQAEIRIYADEGFSGKNTYRPMLMRLIENIKEHKVDYVVCYRLDRISRSVSDFSALIELMNRSGVSFICIKEEFDTSRPMGKAMMYMASVFSQLERETISERVKDNMLELAKNGRWLGGRTPIGYSSEKTEYIDAEGRKRYAYFLVENEKLVIPKAVFDIYYNVGNTTETARQLNAMNYRTLSGKCFSEGAVRDILKNPVYCRADCDGRKYFEDRNIKIYGANTENGFISYNKNNDIIIAVGRHKPVVDGEIWSEINNRIAHRERAVHKAVAYASGAISCGLCGGKMTAVIRSNKVDYDYICENKRNKNGCKNKNLNGRKADEILKKYIAVCENDYRIKQTIKDRLDIVWDGKKLIITEKTEPLTKTKTLCKNYFLR